jgi:hypothetical protein
LFVHIGEIIFLICSLIKQPQLDQIITFIEDLNGTEDDIQITENLIDFIKDKKELGVAARDLKASLTLFRISH